MGREILAAAAMYNEADRTRINRIPQPAIFGAFPHALL